MDRSEDPEDGAPPPAPTARVDHGGEQSLQPGGLTEYCFPLTLDTNTLNRELKLSDDNMKVTRVKKKQPYPDHPDRFDRMPHLLCETGLTGRCYWEVQFRGRVDIAVSYREIGRKGEGEEFAFGWDQQSWCLNCYVDGYSVYHNNNYVFIHLPRLTKRVAVFVDCPAGTVQFFSVYSPNKLMPMYTFHTTFRDTVYPGFYVGEGASVRVCVRDLPSRSVIPVLQAN